MTTFRLRKDLSAHLRRGHPWVYRDALALRPPLPPAGAIVDVADAGGAFVARGFFDPEGPIAVRVLTRDPAEAPDGTWLERRVGGAVRLRAAAAALLDGDARRLLHGEGDGLPGLVLDDYAGTGVVRCDGPAAAAWWQPRLGDVISALAAAGARLEAVWERSPRGRAGDEGGRALRGATPGLVTIREGRGRFAVDVVRGQKTGFFLDQRPGRRRVGELASGADVLNLFCYTGGFSIAAALGGARRVTSVDLAAPAVAAAEQNFALSGLDPKRHRFVAADAFDFLAKADGRWDVVVCDPPSFAPSAKALPRAIAAYRGLNRACAAAVAPGGLLVSASCSSHVPWALFRDLVAEGISAAGRFGRVVDAHGAGPDHPVLPGFPEGNYLKLLVVALD